ncbi:MAG TPA: plastocyanin/azurin family copper-binding protein [Solirubrobacterales bacterium]|nr:plastocyanin/azurin family copper-binding protein [Solirubrobacterales bacterium]
MSAIALLATGALAACGGSDEEEVQKLSFKVNLDGPAGAGGTKIEAPKKAEAGLVEIKYGNNSENSADLQLIRVEGDHDAKEVIDGLEQATKGKPFPDWFFAAGGLGLTEPGETVSVTQTLQPGTYYAFNTEGAFKPKTTPRIEVTGEASDAELDEGAGEVEAGEYVFRSEEPLPAGTNQILFENVGVQPHHMIATKLIGEATAEDVEDAFKSQKGQPPLEEESTQTTAVTEGGEDQLVTFELEPGRYAFYCFITDRQGGKPHALKGMVDEIEVK